jgi:hypothetical protein
MVCGKNTIMKESIHHSTLNSRERELNMNNENLFHELESAINGKRAKAQALLDDIRILTEFRELLKEQQVSDAISIYMKWRESQNPKKRTNNA